MARNPHTKETRQRISERAKERLKTPQDHPNWKGGKRVNHNGYIEVRMPHHHRARGNGYVFEHILVAEEKIGRQLRITEIVHHKNENKGDNSPDNLEVVMRGEHSRGHSREKSGEYLICPICGTQFYVKPSQARRRNTCSINCSGALFSQYYTGKPRGHKPTHNTKEAANSVQ